MSNQICWIELDFWLNRKNWVKLDFWSDWKVWVRSDIFVLIELDHIVDKIEPNLVLFGS